MKRPSIVLFSLGGARADRMSCYGYSRETTPFLDKLSTQGTIFECAVSAAAWALPSHASMFTGLYSSAHQAHDEHRALKADVPTLFEMLHARDYATAMFCGNRWVAPETGFGRGVDRFETLRSDRQSGHAWWVARKALEALFGTRDSGSSRINRAATRWLAGLDRSQSFFAFVHYNETHLHYHPPSRFRDLFLKPEDTLARIAALNQDPDAYIAGAAHMSEDDLRLLGALYDGALRYVDTAVESLVTELRRLGRWQDTIVFVTADHGESLGEHGLMSHKFSLYETSLRVPLILHGPGVPKALRVQHPVQSVDIPASIASLCGLEPEKWAHTHGRPLLDSGGSGVAREYVFAERHRPNLDRLRGRFPDFDTTALDVRMRSVRDGRFKLVWHSDGAHELYDLVADPTETENLIAQMPEASARLQAVLADWHASVVSGEPEYDLPSDFDEEPLEHLAGLGYID